MTIALHPSGITVAEKNKSIITDSLVSEWAWWKMHGAGADPDVLDEARGADAGLQDLALNVAATTDWTANPGWFTPHAAGYNSAVASGTDADTLMALDTLNNAGGVLFMCEIFLATNPGSGNEKIFHYGTNGSGGHYALRLQYGANVNFAYFYQEVGGTLSSSSRAVTSSVGASMAVAVYFDISNNLGTIYVPDTPLGNSTALDLDGSARPGSSIVANPGLGLLGRPTANDEEFGVSTSGNYIRDLFVLRSETDISAQIPGIYAGFAASRPDLPWELEGL